MQVPNGLSRKPHLEGEQPFLRVKDLEENTHMVIRVTTKDWTKHKVLLSLNSKKRQADEEEIPKVFDCMSPPSQGL